MPKTFYQVDAFADRPFAGNPAAVFVLDAPVAPDWMQLVAMEMNLAETAFLVRRAPGEYDLRWFTPAVEVDLCGHATLAAAHVLWETGAETRDTSIRFQTRGGELGATPDGELIELDFPATPPTPVFEDLDLVLGLGGLVVQELRTPFDLMIEVHNETEVRGFPVDLESIRALRARGLIVTARSDDPRFGFVSRFFAPQSGIGEDPVTGSAHCALGPYWAEKLGKTDLHAFQASRRGGEVRVRVHGDRVLLGGRAVTVFQGALRA